MSKQKSPKGTGKVSKASKFTSSQQDTSRGLRSSVSRGTPFKPAASAQTKGSC